MSDIRQWLEELCLGRHVDVVEQETDSEAQHELMSTRPKIASAGLGSSRWWYADCAPIVGNRDQP